MDKHAKSNKLECLVRQIKEKLACLNDGETSPSSYDTAWVARIKSEGDASKPQFPMSLVWICENQLDDGSWGESSYYFLYDRLVNTLACVLVLKIWRTGEQQMLKGNNLFTKSENRPNQQPEILLCDGYKRDSGYLHLVFHTKFLWVFFYVTLFKTFGNEKQVSII